MAAAGNMDHIQHLPFIAIIVFGEAIAPAALTKILPRVRNGGR
jgi:hypothetical protein